ncbi:MAG TPA: restriction endonuclease subunit S [Puia sp.]|nr:restriction endonuclease subunit S [Puia sp.]
MSKHTNTKPFYNSTIPSDWEVKKLKEILIDNKLGGNYENAEANNGIPVIKMGNLDRGTIKIDKIQYLPKNEEYNKEDVLKEGDLLFNTRNTLELVGKVAIWKNELPFAIYNSNLMRMKFDERFVVSNWFMNYAFNSHLGLSQLRGIATGTTSVAAIYGRDLDTVKFALPPLTEQKAIAHILSLMDSAINKNNLLIAKKKLQKKWLMQNLLTGKKRLKGFGEKWKENLMENLFDRVSRKNSEGNTTVVTISAQRGFVRQTDFFTKNIASEITDNYFLVEKGEFCYNKSYSNGYPWGATKRLKDFDKAVVTTLYISFGLKNSQKNYGDFFEQYFEANLLDRGLTKIAHEGGRAHGLLNVTPSDFFSLKITIPEKKEQTAIAQVLQAVDKEIQLLKTKTEKLRAQKKGMIQVLLTGKKRLNQNLQN